MTDINLLKDRDLGDEDLDEKEKQKRKSKLLVELTNPNKKTAQEPTEKPGSGFWSFLKQLFTARRGESGEKGAVRILHEERAPAPPEAKRERPQQKKIEERFVQPQPGRSGVDDVFAPPASPAPEEALPRPVTPAPAPLESNEADLGTGSFSGSVQTPPSFAQTPPLNDTPPEVPPQKQRNAKDQKGGKVPPNEPPDSFLGVNLVPEEMMTNASHQNRLLTLGFLALMSALLVGIAYVGLSIYQSRIVDETQAKADEIANVDRQIQALNDKKRAAMNFHEITKETVTLLDTHVYWTKFFAGLEKYTVENVTIRSFTADQAGNVTISMAGRDYRAVAQQLLAFEAADDFVAKVAINAALISETDLGSFVDFTAIITLDKGVFYRDSTGGPTYTIE